MFVLHAAIKLKPGHEEAAQSVFTETFEHAISAQPGFERVEFLRPLDGGEYVLVIVFDSEALQQEWVRTDLHNQVWSQMEVNFDGWTAKRYGSASMLAPEGRLDSPC